MAFAIGAIVMAYSSSTDMTRLEFWAAVGVVGGVVLFVRGFQMLRYKRLILNTPASKVRSASMGLVEVTGMAKGPRTLRAGITGDLCYYYRAIAWQLKQNGRNRDWQCVANESLYLPFFVEDSTGRMLVNAQGAQVDVHCNFKDEIGTSFFGAQAMMPPHVSEFLLRYGLAGVEGVRLEEYCIKPDYPLFIFGTLGRNANQNGQTWSPDSHFPIPQASHGSKLSFIGPTGNTLLRALGWASGIGIEASVTQSSFGVASVPASVPAGAPSPARASASSWSDVSMDNTGVVNRAGRGATGPPTSPSAIATTPPVAVAEPVPFAKSTPTMPAMDSAGFETHPEVAIGQGSDGAPFTISSRSQREVVESLAWKSTLCIWGGPVLTLVCLYFLSFAFGWM